MQTPRVLSRTVLAEPRKVVYMMRLVFAQHEGRCTSADIFRWQIVRQINNCERLHFVVAAAQ